MNFDNFEEKTSNEIIKKIYKSITDFTYHTGKPITNILIGNNYLLYLRYLIEKEARSYSINDPFQNERILDIPYLKVLTDKPLIIII